MSTHQGLNSSSPLAAWIWWQIAPTQGTALDITCVEVLKYAANNKPGNLNSSLSTMTTCYWCRPNNQHWFRLSLKRMQPRLFLKPDIDTISQRAMLELGYSNEFHVCSVAKSFVRFENSSFRHMLSRYHPRLPPNLTKLPFEFSDVVRIRPTLLNREITFRLSQCMRSQYTNVTDRRLDGQTDDVLSAISCYAW